MFLNYNRERHDTTASKRLEQGSQVTKPGKKDNIMRKKGHQQSQLRKKRTKFFIVYFH